MFDTINASTAFHHAFEGEQLEKSNRLQNSCTRVAADDETSVVESENGYDGLLGREHFHDEFDTEAYLKDFYTNVDDPAMQIVLFYLPNLVARIGKRESLLDFGAGPTIHVAVCFRETVDEIYLADFLPQNRAELRRWLDGRSTFDWRKTLSIVASSEGLPPFSINHAKLEAETRCRVRAILHCNCHAEPPVELPADGRRQFDVVTTFYTLEYCSNTLDEYSAAIRRVAGSLRPGGVLVMGAILEETWCSFGGRRFKCLFVTRAHVFRFLDEAGMDVVERQDADPTAIPRHFEVNGMLIVCARKRV